MINNKDIEERLTAIERKIKHKNREYYVQKDYIVDGKHAGWKTLIPGDGADDDWALIVDGDLDEPLTKAESKVLNSKPGIGEGQKPIESKPTTSSKSKVKAITKPIEVKRNKYDEAAWQHDHIWNIEPGGEVHEMY